MRVSRDAEVSPSEPREAGGLGRLFGIHKSRHVVAKLSGLFALDAFAGGFVLQSFAAYWFYLRFAVNPPTLGVIFFWANILSGGTTLLASRPPSPSHPIPPYWLPPP